MTSHSSLLLKGFAMGSHINFSANKLGVKLLLQYKLFKAFTESLDFL